MLITCYTLQDIKNEQCAALCIKDGYDTGYYKNKECICSESKGKFSDYIRNRITNLPRQGGIIVTNTNTTIEKPIQYYFSPND